MENPLISVIIPTYNAEDTVGRTIRSVEDAPDVEIIVVNDGSTDNSQEAILDALFEKDCHTVYAKQENKGVAGAVNKGLDLARGKYVVLLGSDDWLLEGFDKFRELMKGDADLIFFDLEVNDGSVWHITDDNDQLYVGSVKFMRREFVGEDREPLGVQFAEDRELYEKLLKKNPKKVFTGVVLKHYNFPREGSLCWVHNH